ncbi:hypothetical protein [Streptomyces sp. ID05-47C]|uniref:hypothetical protein n=1 Tax=Streptomyces sp. ID05-47C TaxID=3028665 RepID=UPI0029BD3EA6|nr:hypothetical protein [Streptomyces sp. ID05-47C]MDX3570987.1 hypothetical protein [Streptomyces sp. ID05-47C]
MTTSHLAEKPTARRPETGWARARRLRSAKAALRTWIPAVEAPGTAPATRFGAEGNIVRGED